MLKKSIYDLFFAKGVLLYITVYNVDGELVEWSKAPHWKCGVPQGTEGSNPSLSAIFILNKKSLSKAKVLLQNLKILQQPFFLLFPLNLINKHCLFTNIQTINCLFLKRFV